MDTKRTHRHGNVLGVLAGWIIAAWSVSAVGAPVDYADAPVKYAGAPVEYTAIALGTVNNISAMNEHAEIVGSTTARGIVRAFIVDADARLQLLPLPEKMVSSKALDINDWSEIVGTVSASASAQVDEVAVLWIPDGHGGYKCQVLGTLPGDDRSVATAINNLGDIVGYSSNDRSSRAVLFSLEHRPVDLSGTGMRFPSDINEKRMVIDASPNGLRLDLESMTTKDISPSATNVTRIRYGASVANAINDRNQVAGTLVLSFDKACRQRAARFDDDASGWDILSDCGLQNAAWDINNHGDVLMEIDGEVWVAFDRAGSYPLSDLVKFDWRDWSLVDSQAGALNDAGQVAVIASDPQTGQREAFLLTPERDAPIRSATVTASTVTTED